MIWASFAVAMCVAFAVSALAAWGLTQNATRLGFIDVPTGRSSHEVATPRGGGIGIVAGVGAGIVSFALAGQPPSRDLMVLLLGVIVIAALGILDDRYSVPARYRFLVQLLVAFTVVVDLGGFDRLPLPSPLDLKLGWLGVPVTILWLVGVTNFFNFMDGLDLIAGGQAVASCVGIAIAAWSLGAVQLSVVLALATLGFLIFNFPPARLFLGDAGSTSLGFAIAATPLLGPLAMRSTAVLAVGIGLSLFLLDPLETLLRLTRAGHRPGVAHRLHSYQLLSPTRGTARVVASIIVVCGLVLSIAGALSYRFADLAWPCLVLAAAAYVVEKFLAVRAAPNKGTAAPNR